MISPRPYTLQLVSRQIAPPGFSPSEIRLTWVISADHDVLLDERVYSLTLLDLQVSSCGEMINLNFEDSAVTNFENDSTLEVFADGFSSHLSSFSLVRSIPHPRLHLTDFDS